MPWMIALARRALAPGVTALFAVACQTGTGVGSSSPPPVHRLACGSIVECEQRAAARLDAARHDPASLELLARRFPKGADLHNHLTGAVYAESYLAWARQDGLLLDSTLTLVEPALCARRTCADLPGSPTDPRYDAVLRAWSMKDFVPGAESGHDHFFAAFRKFRPVSGAARHKGEMIADVIRRAADEHTLYLELMDTTSRPLLEDITRATGRFDPSDLPGFEGLLRSDRRWPAMIAESRAMVASHDRAARALLGCDTATPPPACRVTVRYLAQVSRTAAAPRVFAELLAAFEISAGEPRVVGLNLVAPEDDLVARRDYNLHMEMIAMLSDQYRGKSPLRIALHAGELTAALAPATDLESHIRSAVEIAHAERIGHGVDVLTELDAPGLLAELHDRSVTTEICLTSNAYILGVAGAAHPLAAYLAAGVPVTLATDDPGISRSSLTGEVMRAITSQGASYPQLKAMARNGVTAAFLPGDSLWRPGEPGRAIAACDDSLGHDQPSTACAAFLATSERARLQWELERQLAAFEAE